MQITSLDIKEVGAIEEVKRGIIRISGLPNCLYGEEFEVSGLKGMVIEFNPYAAMGIVFGDENKLRVGDTVYSRNKLLEVPVGENFIGRIIDSLGEPVDGKGEVRPAEISAVFRPAAGVMEREPIDQPLLTGTKTVDMLIPLGKGQRELIVGDRQTGKTALALDAIINQKGKDVICIYCWIGGSNIAFQKVAQALQARGAMEYTICVSASGGASSAQQYIAPYTAAALGEYFMYKGKDVLVVFDDLTKHAWIYRQMSLLLERAPGREAYPGDIFFLHSQLMERAGRLKAKFGAGSMTFLPIAEAQAGDITGYIPSNLISMTDGQIYFNTGLFQEGFKPAIDLELSVSRIGSRVQYPATRQLSSGLRYVYVQYRSLLRLTRLRTKLSAEASQQLSRGRALSELLIQENGSPLSLAGQIILFYAFERKILETVNIEQAKLFIREFFDFLSGRNPGLVENINKSGELTEEAKAGLDRSISEFFRRLKPGAK